jgi:hypothetical protein
MCKYLASFSPKVTKNPMATGLSTLLSQVLENDVEGVY